MELWEHPESRVDKLIYNVSRQEVEADDIIPALVKLNKLLEPKIAKRLRGRLMFTITGYESGRRDLWEIAEVKAWMSKLDIEWPYWFYFMDTGTHSTLSFVAFSLCRWEKVPGGKTIPPDELQRFLIRHFNAMNDLCNQIGESREENDSRSQAIISFFFPYMAHSTNEIKR